MSFFMVKSLRHISCVDLDSYMSDYYMKCLNDLANCLNMLRISLGTTLVFSARASLVI